jgi:hypothetical protein
MREPAQSSCAENNVAAVELLDAFRDFLSCTGGRPLQDFVGRINWDMPQRELVPRSLFCLRHLGKAADFAPPETKSLARLLADECENLRWGQTYTAEDFGPDFLDNYGWVEVFGTRGHFANTTVAGGFLLLGPHTVYPDHHHVAEEIYIPLTGGSLWRMRKAPLGPRAAGEVIHHRANVSHAMATLREPLLALYLWRGGDLAQRSTVTGAA